MNYKIIFRTIAQILKLEAAFLLLPLIVAFIYQEKSLYFAFIIPIVILLLIGLIITKIIKQKTIIYAREGFAIVGLSWIILSLFGALPFIISGEIPNFIDAFFETASGFTTTGASILDNVEVNSYSILFWRNFTHWIGGMGVLVFVLAFIPNNEPHSFYILKAESPGPQVGKLVSKVKVTARILYGIYIFLTLLEIILLLFGGMPLFDSITNSFATAGTGGFSIKNGSIGAYNNIYFEIIITIFMIIFGINFNIFYLILIGQGTQALKSEELKWYLCIIICAIIIISINTISIFGNIYSSLRYSSFQVASIISTTGFSSTDFNLWPTLSKWVLILLMFSGACAGSTGGGMKISRIAILIKSIINEIKTMLHPRQISSVKFEKKPVSNNIIKGIHTYLAAYFFIMIIGTLIISLVDDFGILTNFTAMISSLSNIGPGLDIIGPMNSYASYSSFSKMFLAFTMLAGRLEIFPILIIFSPGMWKKV